MATEIQEPADLPGGSITDENAYRYRILVYEQAQDNAGIKKLAIADWKSYLGFNKHMVSNVATFIGIDTDEYDYTQDADVPLPQDVNSVITRINAVADQAGVTTTPTTGIPSLNSRIGTLEDYVKDGWTDESTTPATSYDGLLDRVKSAETNIASIEEEIGGGGGGGSSSLTSRIETLENTVGDSSSGLVKDVDNLQTTVGDSNSGLVKVVGNSGSGLVKDVADLQTAVGDNSSGLTKDVDDLQTTVGDSTSGLVKQVNDNTTKITTLESQVAGIMTFKGNIVGQQPDGGALIIDGDNFRWTDLKHGYTYNINPEQEGDKFVITYPSGYGPTGVVGETLTTTRGDNVVFVITEDKKYFDILGAAVNVSEITDRVSALEDKFEEDKSTESKPWSSDSLTLDGMYMVTVNVRISGNDKIVAVLIHKSGSDFTKPLPLCDTSIYTQCFTEDSNTYNITATSYLKDKTVNAIRIGA